MRPLAYCTGPAFESVTPELGRLGVHPDAIARVKREINAHYGRWKLRSGATLFANAFYLDSANDYDVCDIRGKFCF